jgi:hypothetical protein
VLLLFYFVAGWILYRMPVGRAEFIQSEVRYKFLDLHFDMPRDLLWEMWPWGGSNLYLPDGRVFKISKRDQDMIWLEDPHLMAEQGRTKRVSFEVSPVLGGEYGLAKVVYITSIPGQPDIDK